MRTLLFTFFYLNAVLLFAQNDSTKFYNSIAKQAFTERKFMVAEKNYLKALQFDKQNLQANIELAQAYVEMKKNATAILYFKAAEIISPNNRIALENIAILSYNNHLWNDAILYGKKCIDLKIGEKFNYKIAKSYYQLEDLANSSRYLQAASVEEPKNADVPYTMANIWLDMHNNKKAIEMYSIALSIDTSNGEWFYEAAEIYNALGDTKNALKHYEKALAKGSANDLNSQTAIGIAFIQNGQYEKGVEILKKVIAKKPMDTELFDEMAYAFYYKKNYKDAIIWWDEILKIDKQNAKALYMIGMAFQKDGNKEKGTKLCDAAIAIDPNLAGLKKEVQMPQGMGL